MDELDYLRKEINKIDKDLIELFKNRMEIVSKVADYKKRNSIEILDLEREKQILENHLKGQEGYEKRYLKEFLENIMYISRKSQKDIIGDKHSDKQVYTGNNIDRKADDLKVGYQGVKCSYSYETCLKHFGKDVNTIGYKSFKDVFDALSKGEIDYGVLPVENSSSGSITDVFDLMRDYDFYVVDESILKIEHNLLAHNTFDISDIKEIYSHPQGFLQCSKFFEKYSEIKQMPYFDTAGSAEYISKEGLRHKACVAGKSAATIYGLNIIFDNINNSDNNYTRFLIIAKEMEIDDKADKISLALSTAHKAGSLYKVMTHFAKNNLNMLKIESRPILNKPWQYFFYIDIEGNVLKDEMKNILNDIKEDCFYYKFLGNYKSEANYK